MGAVNFSINKKLLETMKTALPLDVFVETGTFRGDAIEIARPYFKKIYSIELSEEYYQQAKEKFSHDPMIKLLHGDSGEAIKSIVSQIAQKSVFYWLDAHWCVATSTAGELSQCPLLDEIKSIGQLTEDSLVVIDDARLFLAAPPAPHEITHWPTFAKVLDDLNKLSSKHGVMVLNDNIIFYPLKIENLLQAFAYQNGVDWLSVLDKSRDYDILLEQMKNKESEIKSLKDICGQREDELLMYQDQIALRDKKIHEILNSNKYVRILKDIIRRNFGSNLGIFNQYLPKKIAIPKKYYSSKIIKEAPKISIVTPSFNQGDFLERTIKSVISQNYSNLEYIVQDGGSSDRTVDILRQYDSLLTHWESVSDHGQSHAINLGFQHATGEIMAYLNSDDILMPGTLNYVANYFMKNPEIDVVYGHRILMNEEEKEIGRWILPPHKDEILLWADYVPQETLFWRRSLWEKIGGKIDESFQFAMDWDLLLRMREAGAKFVRLPRFLGGFRVHSQQKSSAQISESGNREMRLLRHRYHGREITNSEIIQNVRSFHHQHIICSKLYRLGLLRY